MRARRRTLGGPAPRPCRIRSPGWSAFTVLTRTRRGRTKAAEIRVLTTLLDPDLSGRGNRRPLPEEMAG